jgi:hypothetical protein
MAEFRIEAAPEPRAVAGLFRDWAKVADERDLTFVLPKERLHPAALVLLGAMAASRRRRGLVNHASGDTASNPAAQLLIRADAASTQGTGLRGAIDVLQPVADLPTARKLADRIGDAMAELMPAPSPSIVRMARFVFEEMGANIVQHSDRAETGYGFAAIDPERHRLELAFADAGIGFRASLQRNPEMEGRVTDDAEALQLALSPRITGTSTPRTNMGIGLKTLTDFSDLLGGELWLASGSALLHRRTTAGQRTNVISSIPPWHGSWICLQAPVS